MSEVVDGSFVTPEGRKVFVRARPGESSDDFAERAMTMLSWAGHPSLTVRRSPLRRSDRLTGLWKRRPHSARTASGGRTHSRVTSPSCKCVVTRSRAR